MDKKSLNMFDRTIESVDIVFENCEVYRVPADCIYRMTIDNVKFSFVLHFNGLNKYTKPGETSDFAECEYASIILNEKGMKLKSSWDEMFKDEDLHLLEDRIEANDITHFDINFTDGTNLYIAVPWEDGISAFVNKYQHNDIKDNLLFIDICKKYNIDLEAKANDECYDFYQYENNIDDDVEILEIDDDEENFNHDVPNYIESALMMIRDELDRVMWNIHQQEYANPFNNEGTSFHCGDFDVQSYDWNLDTQDKLQDYNFKWNDYKIRWYKYMGRDMEANRYLSPDECSKMLDECLEAVRRLDIDENDLFDELCDSYDVHFCCQCGEEANKELLNGKYACENCLNSLQKEQKLLKEELEDSLYDFGFDKSEDLVDCIDTFVDFLKFAKSNSTIKNLDHLIKSLEAININIKLENDLLDEETATKIKEFAKNW